MSDDTCTELTDEISSSTELLVKSSSLSSDEVNKLINSIVDCNIELEQRSEA